MKRNFIAASFGALAAALCALPQLSVAQEEAKEAIIPMGYMPEGYRIETIAMPADVQFEVTGLDVNAKGDILVATRFGEVWILDAEHAAGTVDPANWHRFAEGLDESTGVLWDSDGSVIVAQKPQLTRLVDSDKDGKADQFIAVASGWDYHDNYHEFNFGPVKDSQGNYYGTLNLGHNVPNGFTVGDSGMRSAGGYRGWAYKVTTDGKFVPFAYGLRSPAGLGMSPKGELYYTDNQGDWVETSTISLIEEGKFYGHPASMRDLPGKTLDELRQLTTEQLEAMRTPPVIWVPYREVGNSPGNPEWATNAKFGPFEGQAFIGDQTQSNIFRAIFDEVNGVKQGAVINFADGFQSGNIRTRFDPSGRLWVGQTQRGWASRGGKPFGIERLVWDGKTTPFEMQTISMIDGGFQMTFTRPLDRKTVNAGAITAESWSYKYSSHYGSDKINVKTLPVSNVKLSKDGKTVTLKVPAEARTVVEIDFAGLADVAGKHASTAKVYYTANTVK